MGQLNGRTAVAALVAGLAGTAASADVTAEDVWANWRGASAEMGQAVTAGAETRSGDRLTVTDITFRSADEEVVLTAKLGEAVFLETGDGRVEITVSPNYTFTLESGPAAEDEFSVQGEVGYDGLSLIAGGTPEAVSYDFAAEAVRARVTDATFEADPVTLEAQVTMTDMTGAYLVGTGGKGARLDTTLGLGETVFTVNVEGPDDDGTFAMDGTLSDIDVSASSTGFAALSEMDEDSESLPKGLSLDARYTLGSADYSMRFRDGDNGFDADVTSADNALSLLFDEETAAYSVSAGQTDVTVAGPDVPLPEVSVSMAETGLSFDLPIGQSDTPRDMGFGLRLIDIAVSEDVWGLFDPAGTLPRDPATLVLDIAGQANLLVDLFSDGGFEAIEDGTPGEVHSLDLEALRLSALGAAVEGAGGFTFDNSDLTTFDGMPRPEGEVNLTITGANALIDRLVGLGFLPEDQAMAGRMMLGMFARPGEGEDVLTSTIEVRPDGGVWANGQRLR